MSLPVTMPDISKFYREERDHRKDFEVRQKEAYRQALQKQMKDDSDKREREEEYRKKYEIQMLQNYPPFGRRTDFSLNYETVSNASNNVATMKDFDGQIAISNNEKVPKRYTSFEDNNNNIKHSPPEPIRVNNESRLSRDNDNRFSTFGTTTGQDPYYPFGKPGNGAPILDSTGHKQTRIAGNLWFNINGKTPEEINEVRKERLSDYQTRNTLKTVTKTEPAITSMNDDKWIIERKKAFLEQLDTVNSDKYKQDHRLKRPADEYASLRSNANWFNNTFGRPGNGAPLHDPKRHNLEEALESPRGYGSGNDLFQPKKLAEMNTNVLYPKVKPTVSSSHRNTYDYVPSGGKSNIFSM